MRTIVAYPAFKNRRTNAYQALLYEQLQQLGWRVLDLDTGLRRMVRPDIVHLHWPDGFFMHRSLLKSVFRANLLLWVLKLYRLRGAKIIWTVHNIRSHENLHPRLEDWFWRRFLPKLDGWIGLNRTTRELVDGLPGMRDLPHEIIRHGLYPTIRDKNEPEASGGPSPFHMILIGQLRTYKEIPSLVTAFENLPQGLAALTIAGRCQDRGLRRFLVRKAGEVAGLELRLGFLSEDELAQLQQKADAVVIPYSRTLNSGVIFQALSCGNSVIAPGTSAFREIADDFPTATFRLFEPPLTGAKLEDCIRVIREAGDQTETEVPVAYSWEHIGRQHDRYFNRLIGEASG